MLNEVFSSVSTWVFDLDNTLYPPDTKLFDQIERLMVEFMTRELAVTETEANRLRRRYWAEYGTTLSGLIHEHDIDPEKFLNEVHEIDLSAVAANPALARAITALPGRRIVYTNGSRQYAERVTEACGVRHALDAIYGIENAGFVPKPRESAYRKVFAEDGLSPGRAAMFEDEARNLAVPHDLGMHTILVGPAQAAKFVHHNTQNLTEFLSRLV